MGPITTPTGQWVLWDVATGQQLTRWPVDAQGMVASGEYTLTPPEGITPEVPAAPPAFAAPPAQLPPGTSTPADASPGRAMEIKRTRGKKPE